MFQEDDEDCAGSGMIEGNVETPSEVWFLEI